MRAEIKKYLFDIRRAVGLLTEFTTGKDFEDYQQQAILRSAVERQFEIAGEALAQLANLDPDLADRITDYRRIIAFRNLLIHGYADVDDRLVWDIVQTRLPTLRQQIEGLLAEGEGD